jgi:nitrogen regulatory protein P-II 1
MLRNVKYRGETMKMIQAVLRPSKLEDVKKALEDADYTSLTTIEVKGRGRQKGIKQIWRGEEYVVDMLPKVKLEVVVPDEKEDEAVEIIRKNAYTGNIGDGKIFVIPVEKTIRIRTGETDDKAL